MPFDISQVDLDSAPIAYCYDNNSILDHTELCTIDPLESELARAVVWLLPGNATLTAPGKDRAGHVQIWKPQNIPAEYPYDWLRLDVAAQGQDGCWLYIEDHRNDGTVFWLPAEGDKHGSPARQMHTVGCLPDGAVMSEPKATTDELRVSLKAVRNSRLYSADKYVLPDYPISAEKLTAIKTYRQALRDLPAQPGAPWDGGGDETPWPQLPSVE